LEFTPKRVVRELDVIVAGTSRPVPAMGFLETLLSLIHDDTVTVSGIRIKNKKQKLILQEKTSIN
jgi:GTP cyclohydrolase I